MTVQVRLYLTPGLAALVVLLFVADVVATAQQGSSVPRNSAQGSSPSEPSGLIVPGLSVGQLKLGDTRARALELFPFKPNVDQESPQESGCGQELNWVDLKRPHIGNVFIRSRDDVIFQIDVATTRYRTAEGVAVNVSPREVQAHYKGLHAFVLSEITSEAEGNRPIVYWVDSEKGIAFAFAYSKNERRRYLYEIIVFKPRSQVCPSDGSTNSPDKRELPAYSLEPVAR